MKKPSRLLSLALASTLGAAGCGYSAKPMPQIAPSQYSHLVNSNIQIAVEPFDTDKECDKVFQRSVNSKAYLPVLIKIRNNSSEEIKYDRDNIRFVSRTGEEWLQVPGGKMARSYDSEGAVKSMVVGVALGAASGLLSALNEHEVSRNREKDFDAKSLPYQSSLFLGSEQQGFIYFRKSEKSSLSRKDFDREITGGNLSLDILVSPKNNKKFCFEFNQPSEWFARPATMPSQ
ncbi:hypothetical protein J4402_04420 [Candidatus Pacearchaeota archaeon]|nr:hypothetical protein [Candidatus Pacearchaeota archaeon]